MSAAKKIRDQALESGVGDVLAVHGRECVLEHGMGRLSARRARSCLLAPAKGDRVLFAGDIANGFYVLAILEREDVATEIAVEGKLQLRGAACEVRVPGALELRAGSKLSMASSEINVRANRANLALEHLTVLGRRLTVEAESIRSVATKVDRLLGSMRERIQNVYRTVEGLEHVRAGTLDMSATETARVHGRHTLLGADELVKVNGAQVHLG